MEKELTMEMMQKAFNAITAESDVVCQGCGYYWPRAEVNGICNMCKAAETEDRRSETRETDEADGDEEGDQGPKKD